MGTGDEPVPIAALGDTVDALLGDERLMGRVRRAQAAGASERGIAILIRGHLARYGAPVVARGRYLDTTRSESSSGSIPAEWERILYDRGGGQSIDRDDEHGPAAPLLPEPPTIRVPRRTEVVDGSGDVPPRPWKIPVRRGDPRRPR